MKKYLFTSLILLLTVVYGSLYAQIKTYSVKSFDKVTVSPHIQVDFIQGDREDVVIDDISVTLDKLNIEQNGNNIHLYLDGAKTVTKNEKSKGNGYNVKHPIYNGTIVRATVYFKHLSELSLRGEEDFRIKSPVVTDKFVLTLYGESEVVFEKVVADTFKTVIYGESELKLKEGKIGRHKIIAYGESEVNAYNVETKTARVTSYGESDIELNVLEELKVTSYGEARVRYKGDPVVNKGIVIGDASIEKRD